MLYRINYPSLKDNNVLRRVLLCEVLFWAEELKRRWTVVKSLREESEETEEDWTEHTGEVAFLCLCPCSGPLLLESAFLSGSLANLRVFLTNEPMVKLSQDGSALLLQTDEDEEYDEDLEDSDYEEVEQNQTLSPKHLENWEEE
ncbi:hypothetical protein WMY93_002625 [Mugilogobius chulae]|uniref:Uncharacterized protein n=1 Tax=Mugilogobius chulae TaxID=88201 RepID=A0AAW0Q5A2_9GOBI